MPSPLITATTQAAVISATSNVLAQIIKATREDKSISLEVRPVLIFVIWTLISCPPNYLWQMYLEEKFPGNKLDRQGGKSLDKVNTAKKFALDQTIGAAVNNVAYIAAMAAFKGKTTAEITDTVTQACNYLPSSNPLDTPLNRCKGLLATHSIGVDNLACRVTTELHRGAGAE